MDAKPTKCHCGCGGTTKGGRYLPGHDAKLKGKLLDRARNRSGAVAAGALNQLKKLGWTPKRRKVKVHA